MEEILQFLAAHDVAVGMVGTLIVILAVIVGFGRRHNAVMSTRLDGQARPHRKDPIVR
ncbi:hypothetical protein [Glacieibacterium sp.]|uniref:hypothetical protein n=1 Tax=Glacieibacterium sp. TaxID=2860237 RepID=UPI003AFFACFD